MCSSATDFGKEIFFCPKKPERYRNWYLIWIVWTLVRVNPQLTLGPLAIYSGDFKCIENYILECVIFLIVVLRFSTNLDEMNFLNSTLEHIHYDNTPFGSISFAWICHNRRFLFLKWNGLHYLLHYPVKNCIKHMLNLTKFRELDFFDSINVGSEI